MGPVGPDDQESAAARLEALGFRARGESVYPGVLLVLKGGSSHAHPVEDDAYDRSIGIIVGIAVWGALAEAAKGMIRVEAGPEPRFTSIAAGEVNRPTTGVARIDAWIARADTLRKLRGGSVVSFGPLPLTRHQLRASIGEIGQLVRKSAIALIRSAPPDQRPALLALGRVADTEHPQTSELTAAILELVVSAPAWAKHSALGRACLSGDDGSDQSIDRSPSDGGNTGGKPSEHPANSQELVGPALTVHQSRVLKAMALVDATQLMSSAAIGAEMDPVDRLSARTIGPILQKLIDLGLAERPQGERQGARLTTAGRRLASRIAD